MHLRLTMADFDPVLLEYPSRSSSIAEMTDILWDEIPDTGKVNFVGHSLGGILAKRLTKRLPKSRRGRIVQLGSPNFGTEIALRAELLGPLMGPALAELTPQDASSDENLAIGAIAGTAALPALSLLTGIEGENDGKVSVESAWGHAKPECRIKLPVAHSTLMLSSDVIKATMEFLETGKFSEKWRD